MLQLVQAIKHEPFCDSSLVRFIIRRGLRNPQTVGHALFWALEAELERLGHQRITINAYGAQFISLVLRLLCFCVHAVLTVSHLGMKCT